MIATPLSDYVQQMTLKFILGTENIDTGWDNYVKQCEAKGSQRLMDLYNKVYQDTKSLLQ